MEAEARTSDDERPAMTDQDGQWSQGVEQARVPPTGLTRFHITTGDVPHGVNVLIRLRSLEDSIPDDRLLVHSLVALRFLAGNHDLDWDAAVEESEELHDNLPEEQEPES